MKIIHSAEAMHRCCVALRNSGKSVGFVPTMGYLHAGHQALICASVRQCDATVVSVYVNPRQFGPGEDFARYPRDLRRDRTVARQAGADYLFVPDDGQIYPAGFDTQVQVVATAQGLCGATRPGHFSGVATVVAILLHIVQPQRVYFGQKDAQQCAVIRRMVDDLRFPTQVRVLPTVREPDGLALSSRNAYLSASQRRQAPGLYRALRAGRAMIIQGKIRDAALVLAHMRSLLCSEQSDIIEYLSIVDAGSLRPSTDLRSTVLLVGALRLGPVRLIDNVLVRGSPRAAARVRRHRSTHIR